MASDNETVADIVREMRNDRGVDNAGWFEGKHMRWFADRIEAAHNREVKKYKPSEGNSNWTYADLEREVALCVEESNKQRQTIDDLRSRLKVAEVALELCKDGMCGECKRQHHEGVCVFPNGCYEMAAVRNALVAIREEGGAE